MKKIIIISTIFLAATITAFTPQSWFTKEKPVNKEINLSISSNNNYSSAAYDEAKASVHVVITKVSGSKQTVVLDKVYDAMQLKQIPTNGNAIYKNVTIPNVFNDKEKLIINYTICYDSRGSIIQLCNDKIASDKTNTEKIEINI